MRIIKRDGTEVDFDKQKIVIAIENANNTMPTIDKLDEDDIINIADSIEKDAEDSNFIFNVEDVQNKVEDGIWSRGKFNLGRSYSQYRTKHAVERGTNTFIKKVGAIVDNSSQEIKEENSNKNPTRLSVQRDYMAGEGSKEYCREKLIPKDVLEAHDNGIIHFHDMDYFAHKGMVNCCLINIEDMLNNGTVINETPIFKPKSFMTACTVTSQIIAMVASNQFGGQSVSLAHLAPFVDVSRQKIRRELLGDFGVSTYDDLSENDRKIFDKQSDRLLEKEIKAGIQTLQYQILTLMTTNGQTPFVTLFMYLDEAKDALTKSDLARLIEEVLKQRIEGIPNKDGVPVTPTFPKLIYVLDEENITEDSKYWYLTKLAAECTAKRMVPDYISAKIMKEIKDGYCYPVMGCRSALTSEPDILNEDGTRKFYGRFNQGVVTINLPYVALSSNKDEDVFWKNLDEYLELCHKALRVRHDYIKGSLPSCAPILWQYGAYARLKEDEPIDKLLYGGYSTISLGCAGLYECTKYMTGQSHTNEEKGKPFALRVMQYLNDKCKQWREAENIAYSVYGTPLESTTYKFAKACQKRFGVIEGVTDKNYITNSYHIHVTENIDAFAKLKLESEFQRLTPGGAISYIEAPDLKDNIDAVISVMQFIYDNIMYAELNTKFDYCHCCGYTGEILMYLTIRSLYPSFLL